MHAPAARLELSSAVSAASANAEPRTIDQCAAACSIDLPAGVWRLSTRLPNGWWAGPREITVTAEPRSVEVPIFPTGALTGRVKVDKGQPAVTSIRVLFRPSAPDAEEPVGEALCDVLDSRWKCDLPAGKLDLRLHAAAYVSHYLWGAGIQPSHPHDLGELLFRRGASLVGKVAFAAHVKKQALSSALLMLAPKGAVQSATPSQTHTLTRVTRPNVKGFFQFADVPPGDYVLMAKATGVASDRRTIRVIAEREAELRDSLILDTPKSVELTLFPALDPALKPWRGEVLEVREEGRRREPLSESASDGHGRWRAEGLRSGQYVVSIKSSSGDSWKEEEIVVEGADITRAVTIPMVTVEGVVTMAAKPLPAALTFSGPNGASLRLQSAEDGSFMGALPFESGGSWAVTVTSAPLHIRRTIDPVGLRLNAEGTRAHADIDLPALSIAGKVVDEEGKPVARAIVTAVDLAVNGEMTQMNTEQSGAFLISGLSTGKYRVHAESYLHESDPVELDPSEDPGRELTLVVKENPQFRVGVLSDSGPVVGARVWGVSTDRAQEMLYPRPTDVNGIATLLLRPGTQELDVYVAAPGFPLRTLHRHIDESRLLVRVGQIRGGNLRIRLPNFEHRDDRGFVIHDGAVFGSFLFGIVRDMRTDPVDVTLADIEAGQYAVCFVPGDARGSLRAGSLPPDRCRAGQLDPGGELLLDLSGVK